MSVSWSEWNIFCCNFSVMWEVWDTSPETTTNIVYAMHTLDCASGLLFNEPLFAYYGWKLTIHLFDMYMANGFNNQKLLMQPTS